MRPWKLVIHWRNYFTKGVFELWTKYRFFIKVRQFQNEFMKTSFLPKYEHKIVKFLASLHRAEIVTNFCLYIGRKDDFINSFWNCLTFSLFELTRKICKHVNLFYLIQIENNSFNLKNLWVTLMGLNIILETMGIGVDENICLCHK